MGPSDRHGGPATGRRGLLPPTPLERERLQADVERRRLQAKVGHYQRRLGAAQAEIARLAKKVEHANYHLHRTQRDLEDIVSSGAWRWALRVRRLRHELIGGSWGQRRAFAAAFARRALGAGGAPPEAPPAEEAPSEAQAGLSDAELEALFDTFVERATASRSPWVVVLFTATVAYQLPHGHPFQRMARVLRDRDIPVVFSYFRYAPDPIIPTGDPLLFQVPTDLTSRFLDAIARHDFDGKKRLFVAGLPHLTCARWAQELATLGWVTLYHCVDEWEEFSKVQMAGWYHEGVEPYLANVCDVVTATAKSLVAKMQRYAPTREVHLSCNAYDTEFVSPDQRGRTAPREGDPVAGYFGTLTEKWFDWPVLIEVARREPDWQFELIGRAAPEHFDLPPNIRLLGMKFPAEISRIAQRWRAGLLVRKINRLTEAMDAVKVYEYLGLGLPTVCTTMPQIEDYPYVFSAPNPEGFREQLARAMVCPIDRRVIDDFLAVNRWEDRIDQIMDLSRAAASASRPPTGIATSG